MKVYRICNRTEFNSIMRNRNFLYVGREYTINPKKNSHQYKPGIRYLHFYASQSDLIYLTSLKEKYLCIYEIPNDLLIESAGFGNYIQYIYFRTEVRIPEYAIDVEKLKFEYLKNVFKFQEEVHFEEFSSPTQAIYSNAVMIYEAQEKSF